MPLEIVFRRVTRNDQMARSLLRFTGRVKYKDRSKLTFLLWDALMDCPD